MTSPAMPPKSAESENGADGFEITRNISRAFADEYGCQTSRLCGLRFSIIAAKHAPSR